MPFVLGASIAAAWAFADEDHPTAALAVGIWWFEELQPLSGHADSRHGDIR